ncbi:hypothetical protein BST61_g10927 [Cercospora zeina]
MKSSSASVTQTYRDFNLNSQIHYLTAEVNQILTHFQLTSAHTPHLTIPEAYDVRDNQVLTTIEWLELILLHIPIGATPRAQRVCKLWHTMITSSNNLRQALFLHPVSPSSCQHNQSPTPKNLFHLAFHNVLPKPLRPQHLQNTRAIYSQPQIILSSATQEPEINNAHHPNRFRNQALNKPSQRPPDRNISPFTRQPPLGSVNFFHNHTPCQRHFNTDDDSLGFEQDNFRL